MEKIRRVLAATDFSPRAGRAVDRAAQIAHEHEAELYLLHVLPVFPLEALKRLMVETPPETEQRLYNQARAALQQEAKSLAREGIVIRQHVAIGRAHIEINRYAKSHQIDLLVIGDQGESFARELFLGTTASKTLRTGGHPLLITKQEPRGPYKHVLVPVDFSPSSLEALDFASKMVTGERIRVLHALNIPLERGMEKHTSLHEEWIDPYRNEITNRAQEDMDGVVEGYASRHIPITPLIDRGPAPVVIREKARELDIDLIVIGKRGETELDDALLGSVTKHVLYETTCDVLIVSPATTPNPSG